MFCFQKQTELHYFNSSSVDVNGAKQTHIFRSKFISSMYFTYCFIQLEDSSHFSSVDSRMRCIFANVAQSYFRTSECVLHGELASMTFPVAYKEHIFIALSFRRMH